MRDTNKYRASHILQRFAHLLILIALAPHVVGCGDGDGHVGIPLLTGDLDEIRERGDLRILAPRRMGASGLHRTGSPLQLEGRLAEAFAELEGLEPTWVWVDDYSDLIPALTEGRGDMIAANLTVTAERQEQIAFGPAFAHAYENVVTHRD